LIEDAMQVSFESYRNTNDAAREVLGTSHFTHPTIPYQRAYHNWRKKKKRHGCCGSI